MPGLKASNLTALLITEVADSSTPHDVESYVVDGVVKLVSNATLKMRFLSIEKMRSTKMDLGANEFDFTESGISLKTNQRTKF